MGKREDTSDGPAPAADGQLVGAKYLKVLRTHLKRLRVAGDHPNRVLRYDDLLTLLLLGFFNPTLRSLRTLEDASASPRFQGVLGVERACRSTVSDANACLDPALLLPLIDDLRRKVPRTCPGPTASSSSSSTGPSPSTGHCSARGRGRRLGPAEAQARRGQGGRRPLRPPGPPVLLRHRAGRGAGDRRQGNQRDGRRPAGDQARRPLRVADRGIFSFAYVRDLLDAGADFVLRIKASQRLEVVGENPLTQAQRAAGVLSDRLVRLAPSQPGATAPDRVLREVVVFDERNPDKPVRLLTSLAEVDAELVGEVYRWRWQVELFFRWLKVHAHFRHVISRSKNGLTLSFYVAVIGVLLMYLHSGRRVSKYAYNLLCLVAQGGATLADVLPILERREGEKDLARARLARRRAEKTPA